MEFTRSLHSGSQNLCTRIFCGNSQDLPTRTCKGIHNTSIKRSFKEPTGSLHKDRCTRIHRRSSQDLAGSLCKELLSFRGTHKISVKGPSKEFEDSLYKDLCTKISVQGSIKGVNRIFHPCLSNCLHRAYAIA